jgi:protein-export SecD/SecF family membrane protein
LSIFVAAVAFFSFISFEISGTIYDYKGVVNIIKLGIDLEGGVYVVLEPDETDPNYTTVTEDNVVELIQSTMGKIRARLDSKGYTEATITKQGTKSIRIEIPSITDPDEVFSIIGSTGKLEFRLSETGEAQLTGEDVKEARVGYDKDGKPIVALKFTPNGAKLFAAATKTAAASSSPLYIYLDDEKISEPTVSQEIATGEATIENSSWTGTEGQKAADNLANLISSGSLPIKFNQTESRTISSSLGETALSGGLLAGGIGILLVIIFMILVYKGLGVIADYSLIIYILLLLLALALLPWVQLTLAGIAGVILGIGMAVDANVIIFERIKEEYNNGKTIETAIKVGFRKSTMAILDSNITTLIATSVLWILGTGSVKGFAVTLFISIIISMFTALLVTRWLIKLFMPLIKKKEKFLGLKREVTENA